MSTVETERLLIRPFTPADWEGLQAMAIDKETLKRDPHDPPWPTSDDGCRALAQYLAEKEDQYSAVVVRSDRRLIGLLAFNHIDNQGQLELGYQFHSAYQDMVHDWEALAAIIEHAFADPGVRSVDTRTNADWAEQIAPLRAFGFEPIDREPGHLCISKATWRARPQNTARAGALDEERFRPG